MTIMLPTFARRINRGWAWKLGASVMFLALAVLASSVPTRAQEGDAPDATAVLDRALGFFRAHPRMQGHFAHRYLDRDRTVDLRTGGRFALQLPQIGITFEGDAAPSRIAVDATSARVLQPREGEAPLLLSFRLDTTPLPPLLAVLDGTAPLESAFAARRIATDDGGDVVELRPIDPTSQVDRIWLEVASSGAPTRLLVVDWRGATHRVTFDAITTPARLPAGLLAPTFPADAILVEP